MNNDQLMNYQFIIINKRLFKLMKHELDYWIAMMMRMIYMLPW